MPSGTEPGVEAFFASRGGVCVYVKVEGHNFRVQFAAPDAHGTVSEGADGPAADKALTLARSGRPSGENISRFSSSDSTIPSN